MEENRSSFDHLALEFVRVTEAAALASAKWIGKGNGKAADQAAVDAMRQEFSEIHFNGEIVIGEGAKDEAPEIYIGEKVGNGEGPELDIAVDPLECTDNVASGKPNAIAVIAVGPKGTLYKAVDAYMEKIAVAHAAVSVVDLDAPIEDNIRKTAKALGKDISEITVAVLDRERHKQLIADIRKAGARIRLFANGDVAMAIAPSLPDSPIDMLIGTGGSTEAVLAAAALKCIGGAIFCRWDPKDENQTKRIKEAGIEYPGRVFSTDDLARGDEIAFTATGVLTGPLLEGAVFTSRYARTHSVVMSTKPRVVRFLEARHY